MASTINAKSTGSGSLESTADASGVLGLQTGGVTAVTIDTSQNVGIGTTSPNGKFESYANSGYSVIANSSAGSVAINPSSNAIVFGTTNVAAYATGNYDAATHVYKTSGTERMRIDSSGRITMPYQPAFCASSSSGTTTVAAGALFPFNNELFDRGNNYNPSTYIFTAPVSGYYFFMATFYLQGRSSICFKVNGSEYGAPTPLAYAAAADQYDTGRSLSFIVSLSANDTVSVASRSTESSVFYGPHSNWLGYFLG